jgi:hypothetical protein
VSWWSVDPERALYERKVIAEQFECGVGGDQCVERRIMGTWLSPLKTARAKSGAGMSWGRLSQSSPAIEFLRQFDWNAMNLNLPARSIWSTTAL